MFGGYIPNGNIANNFCYMGTRNSILSYFPNQSQVNYTAIDYGNKHNYKFIKTDALNYSYYYDGNLVGTTSLVNNVGCKLAVFSFIDNDGVTRTANTETFTGRIYKFIIYDGDKEVCNLIPCIRVTDNKPGMYDTVSDKFYSNEAGGEDFIAGPVLS